MRNLRMPAAESGFALVELIVVMVIVCILLAFAVPRFSSFEIEARSSAIRALGGVLRSQAARAHGLWLIQGQPDAVDLDGVLIPMTHGYPAEAAIAAAIDIDEKFVVDGAASPVVISKSQSGTLAITNCSVSYAAAPSAATAPTVQVDISGC